MKKLLTILALLGILAPACAYAATTISTDITTGGTLTVGPAENSSTGLLSATNTARFVSGFNYMPFEGYDTLFQFRGLLGDSPSGDGWEALAANFALAPETDGQYYYGPTFNSYTTNTKHIAELDGLTSQAYTLDAAAIDLMQGIVSTAANYSGGVVTENRGFSAYTGGSGIVSNSSFYAGTPRDAVSLVNNYGIWLGDQSGPTNSYAFWYDSPGVYRIKSDGVMAYYNPSFVPKYTPSSGNYERIVQQWSGNTAQYGTENSGTGVARPLAFITASTTRLTIGATGNVGIGTASPSVPLEVATSSSNATTSVILGKTGQNKGTCLEMYDATGVVKYISIVSGAFVISSTSCK